MSIRGGRHGCAIGSSSHDDGALQFDTSTFHYKSRRTDQAAVSRRIKEICETRVRYGYRRVHVLLRREGWVINIKKTRRIYNELGLQLRNKNPKRRVKAKLRDDRQEAVGPKDIWAMDFVHDQLALGTKVRILTIVDIHSRFCPAADPRLTYRGEDVVRHWKKSVRSSAIQGRSGWTTSYVRRLVLLKASDPGTSKRLDALKRLPERAPPSRSGLIHEPNTGSA